VAILGPSCKADCKLVALAMYLLFRTKRSDTGLHGGVCGPLQVMKASNVLPSPWGMGTLPPVPLQCPMVGLAAADGLHTTPYDTRPAICMVEYGVGSAVCDCSGVWLGHHKLSSSAIHISGSMGTGLGAPCRLFHLWDVGCRGTVRCCAVRRSVRTANGELQRNTRNSRNEIS